ncbi:MAG TPA: hypothetical protein VH933_16730 [Aestuariivirgaceae bacterium]|jgi:hypothetical protein
MTSRGDWVTLPMPRPPVDPALPGDGGAGGITDPDGKEAGETETARKDDDNRREAEEIEVGDPRDGP